LLSSRRSAIGTRLLNLSDVDSDHPEPMVQDMGRAACAGPYLCGQGVWTAATPLHVHLVRFVQALAPWATRPRHGRQAHCGQQQRAV